jgi:hypothetical protein
MTILELMAADAKAAQARQKKTWGIGCDYDDGKTVSVSEITQPRPSDITTHAVVGYGFDLAYNPGFRVI